jgi:hypothetical protein
MFKIRKLYCLQHKLYIVCVFQYKLPGSDQIPTELSQAAGETLWSEIHKLINFYLE